MQKICDNCHRRFWTEDNPDYVVLSRHNYNRWFCSLRCAKGYCDKATKPFKKALRKKKITVRSNAPVRLI